MGITIGFKFGKWTIIGLGYNTRLGRKYLCQCDCGTERHVLIVPLLGGRSRSCGCGKKGVRRDISGERFGRLMATSFHGRAGSHMMWNCHCDCGNNVLVGRDALLSGVTLSCGCLHAEIVHHKNTRHGESGRTRTKRSSIFSTPRTKEYQAWVSMKRRCSNPKGISFKNYGGRGIKICNQWLNSYECFLTDVGRAPTENHTIDRIDVNGNYEPNNVRWADRKTQTNNQRRNLCQPAVDSGLLSFGV